MSDIIKVGDYVFYIVLSDETLLSVDDWFENRDPHFVRDEDYRLEDSCHPMTPSACRMIWNNVEHAIEMEEYFKNTEIGVNYRDGDDRYYVANPDTKLMSW